MFNHAIEWVEMIGTVAESLLLIRVVSLRLHRIYAFLTLYCALNVLFDGVSWYLGWESRATAQVIICSLFFFALLAPFAAWDAFEESKAQLQKLRRLQALRLVSGMIITAICALLVGFNVDTTDANGNTSIAPFVGVLMLTGSAASTASFLWFMQRTIRRSGIQVAHNTAVWSAFLLLTLSFQIADCLSVVLRPLMPAAVADGAGFLLVCFDLGLTVWCLLNLKAVASDVPSTPQKASL